MPKVEQANPKQVNASPTKDFFVSMLTRDIELEDSILDLLDNCVDGIHRKTRGSILGERPFEGFHARISFNKNEFRIEDNCGGIALDNAIAYAFRMGRPGEVQEDAGLPVIGTYGIGMKRAMFKMGRDCIVESRTADESFSVNIPTAWFSDPDDWDFDLTDLERGNHDNGTKIIVRALNEAISEKFDNKNFEATLIARIAQSYSFIINKGFRVEVNDITVKPSPLSLLFNTDQKQKTAIRPYIYTDEIEGVTVSLAVGFYRPLPTDAEIEADKEGTRYSSETAGWTIICNDRVVVYCDRSMLTGWGDASVPNYHTQYIAISGVVIFTSSNAWKLPITTTKRGIDASSDIYLRVKNYMRDGMKVFTNYTNKWKSDKVIGRKHIEVATAIPVTQVAAKIKEIPSSVPFKKPVGEKSSNALVSKPILPMPEVASSTNGDVTIKFSKSSEEVKLVSGYLFEGDGEKSPAVVGEECFDFVRRRVRV
jgi:Histidine kinase-, DNA gyrase B-, and HSP90-like ATPase